MKSTHFGTLTHGLGITSGYCIIIFLILSCFRSICRIKLRSSELSEHRGWCFLSIFTLLSGNECLWPSGSMKASPTKREKERLGLWVGGQWFNGSSTCTLNIWIVCYPALLYLLHNIYLTDILHGLRFNIEKHKSKNWQPFFWSFLFVL